MIFTTQLERELFIYSLILLVTIWLHIQIIKPLIDQFRYIKIRTWLRGLGVRGGRRNVVFITELQDDFFCFIPLSLTAK